MSNTSRSRAVIVELMDKLFVVRNIEKSIPHKIKYEFGNLADKQHGAPPRLIWTYEGGKVLEKVPAPPVVGDPPEKNVPAVGFRRSDYKVRIWMPDLEACEIVLDQLVTASLSCERPDKYDFEGAPYEVPTQLDGKYSELGQVIDAHIGIKSSVPAAPVGIDIDVIVGDWQFRAGIENPVGEPLAESEYDVDRIDPTWPGE